MKVHALLSLAAVAAVCTLCALPAAAQVAIGSVEDDDAVPLCTPSGPSILPGFIEHCAYLLKDADAPCSQICFAAFALMSNSLHCLTSEEVHNQGMEEHGFSPLDLANVMYVEAFARCSTYEEEAEGGAMESCTDAAMVHFETEALPATVEECIQATNETCSESCATSFHMLREHHCFAPWFSLHRARSPESTARVQELSSSCSASFVLMREMCEGPRVDIFQRLTWRNFEFACAGVAGAAKRVGTPNMPSCEPKCITNLELVLAEPYCLQRMEANAAEAGDVGASILLGDALVACDMQHPTVPTHTGKAIVTDKSAAPQAKTNAGTAPTLSLLLLCVAALCSWIGQR